MVKSFVEREKGAVKLENMNPKSPSKKKLKATSPKKAKHTPLKTKPVEEEPIITLTPSKVIEDDSVLFGTAN